MAKITWTDRVENSGATAEGKVNAAVMNEIKVSVNAIYDLIASDDPSYDTLQKVVNFIKTIDTDAELSAVIGALNFAALNTTNETLVGAINEVLAAIPDISGKADKATGHTTGNLAKLDAVGNAVDSGEASEFLDIYNDVPADVKTYLETDSNWLSGANYLDEITVTGFANDGETGMRFKDTKFFFECVSNGIGAVWTRYPISSAYFDPFGIPSTEKTKLETGGNWTGTTYTGTALVNCQIGSEHFDATYFYKFVDNNLPIRLTRS